MKARMRGFLFFVVVWNVACALQLYAFKIENDTLLMLYGMATGLLGGIGIMPNEQDEPKIK